MRVAENDPRHYLRRDGMLSALFKYNQPRGSQTSYHGGGGRREVPNEYTSSKHSIWYQEFMGRLRLPNQRVELLRFMPPPTATVNSGDVQAFF